MKLIYSYAILFSLIFILSPGCKKKEPTSAPTVEQQSQVQPISTTTILAVTDSSATGSDNVPADMTNVAAYGLCWDTLSMPTTTHFNHIFTITGKTYTCVIKGLKSKKIYYVRSFVGYSINGKAFTSYGIQVSLTTL